MASELEVYFGLQGWQLTQKTRQLRFYAFLKNTISEVTYNRYIQHNPGLHPVSGFLLNLSPKDYSLPLSFSANCFISPSFLVLSRERKQRNGLDLQLSMLSVARLLPQICLAEPFACPSLGKEPVSWQSVQSLPRSQGFAKSCHVPLSCLRSCM